MNNNNNFVDNNKLIKYPKNKGSNKKSLKYKSKKKLKNLAINI